MVVVYAAVIFAVVVFGALSVLSPEGEY